jgi:outer membrane biosynthesis protein TonB
MKTFEVLRIASLFLLPGAIAPVYAQGQREQEKQPEKQQQAKPAQPQQRAQQPAKPAQPQQRAQQPAKPAQPQQRAQQPAKPAQQQQRAQQPAKPAQQQRAQQPAKPARPQQRAQQPAKPGQQSADRTQTEAPGRIPDERFRASFGRGHTFHVSRSDFAGGSRRFQYGGFWFAMVNPWPVGWLYTDSVYVDYMNGGYFLCDPIHPGVYLSITVG